MYTLEKTQYLSLIYNTMYTNTSHNTLLTLMLVCTLREVSNLQGTQQLNATCEARMPDTHWLDVFIFL